MAINRGLSLNVSNDSRLQTVSDFSDELKISPLALIEQLAKAGVVKQNNADTLTEQDKVRLLEFLRKSHGETAPKVKITLPRKQTTEIKVTDASSKARTIELRKKKKKSIRRIASITNISGSKTEIERIRALDQERQKELRRGLVEAAKVNAGKKSAGGSIPPLSAQVSKKPKKTKRKSNKKHMSADEKPSSDLLDSRLMYRGSYGTGKRSRGY